MVNNDFDKSFNTLLQELEESYALVQYVNEKGIADIPDTMTSIAKKAFFACDNLKSITIPNSVTSIGERAFCCCKNLECVTIPGSVTSIGEGAFWGCKKLTIHAPSGSYAEQYAKENDIQFVTE